MVWGFGDRQTYKRTFVIVELLLRLKKLSVGNGEAICSNGEAIVLLDYSISSGPFSSVLQILFDQ